MTLFIIKKYTARAYAVIKKACADNDITEHRIVSLFNEDAKPSKLNMLTAAAAKLPQYFDVKISGKKAKKAELLRLILGEDDIVACGIDVIRMIMDDYDAKLNRYRRYKTDRRFCVACPFEDAEGFKADMQVTRMPVRIRPILDYPPYSVVTVDIETNCLYPWLPGARILSVSLTPDTDDMTYVGTFEEFKRVAIPADCRIIGHNLKFDLMWLKYFGVDLTANPLYDTMVAENLIDENTSKGLDSLVFKYTPYENYWADIDYTKLETMDIDTLQEYNGCDTVATYAVYEAQKGQSFSPRMLQFEMEKLVALLNVQLNGMYVNKELLKIKQQEAANHVQEAKDIIGKEAPDINPNSGKQLGRFLYERSGFTPTFTDKGQYKTDNLTLQGIQGTTKNPVLDAVIKLRTYNKLLNTYYANIEKNLDERGYIHGNFNTCTVVTGRLSSSGGVNFQNIPARDASQVESLFEPRYSAGHICKLDYSQMELRLLADLSRDKTMLQAFKEGEDFHDTTARLLNIERQQAKTTNFRIVYGGGSQREALEWFAAYPGARNWIDSVVKNWQVSNTSFSPLGRTRHLKYNRQDDWKEGKHKERQSFNSIIQGMASDVTMIALLLLDKAGFNCVNTVHDSILLDFARPLVLKDKCILRQICEEKVPKYIKEHFNYQLDVPLKIDVSTGSSWGECK